MGEGSSGGRPRILLLVAREPNRRQLADWLAGRYDVEAQPDGPVADALARCDLCVVDSRTVRQHREVLEAGRSAAQPVFLPVLLMLTGAGQSDRTHWGVVDDMVETPVRKAALGHRIEVLLRARRYSLDLKRRNARLERFAGIVTHDLRNPHNIAQGSLGLARQNGTADAFDRVERALERMETIIDEVLELARLGSTVGERQPIQLADIVEDAWAGVETRAATLTVEFDEAPTVVGDESRVVVGDESRVVELFENLFRNAIEHAGPDIRVAVGPLEDRNGLFLEDDGPGIPAEDRDDVFEYGTTTTEGGTGFGLTIVRAIVEAHDWSIRITDGRTGGARFEISFGEEPDRFRAELTAEGPGGSPDR